MLEFGSNCTVSGAVPLPDGPDGNVIHVTFDVALQAQPAGAVTVICLVPPLTLKLAGETL